MPGSKREVGWQEVGWQEKNMAVMACIHRRNLNDAMLSAVRHSSTTQDVMVPLEITHVLCHKFQEGMDKSCALFARSSTRSLPRRSTTLQEALSDRTSGTPNPCCPAGTLGESSTSARCSGSGRHAIRGPDVSILSLMTQRT